MLSEKLIFILLLAAVVKAVPRKFIFIIRIEILFDLVTFQNINLEKELNFYKLLSLQWVIIILLYTCTLNLAMASKRELVSRKRQDKIKKNVFMY